MKNLEYYKNLEYRIIIEKQSFENETYYICYTEEFGKYSCFGQGANSEEAITNYQLEKDIYIESLFEENLKIPIPESSTADLLSGSFIVRTDPVTHTKLARQAKKSKLSLNQYVNSLLYRNSILDSYVETITPKFDEMKELIVKHDCNVKQQFMNLWLNMGMKKVASTINKDWNQEMEDNLCYKDIAA